MDWLGIIRRTAGHSRLTGPWAGGGEAPQLGHGGDSLPILWRTLSQP